MIDLASRYEEIVWFDEVRRTATSESSVVHRF